MGLVIATCICIADNVEFSIVTFYPIVNNNPRLEALTNLEEYSRPHVYGGTKFITNNDIITLYNDKIRKSDCLSVSYIVHMAIEYFAPPST